MALFPVLLFLAAVLLPFFPANGKESTLAAINTTQKVVQREIVKKHNDVRRSVFPRARNMLKMQWDSKAAANSQKWANKCTFQHSDQNDRKVGKRDCGENIFMSSKPTPWSRVIKTWFNEGINFIYGYGAKRSDIVVGHYTQVVWYSSYLVGCGVAYCPKHQNLKYYYVCHYCPSGNIGVGRSLTPYLKGTPCGSCPNNCDQGLCTNPCEHDNDYSNCHDMMSEMGCKNDFVSEHCKAACNCSKKIY
ncbi:cysteine-rich secretory protein 3 [Pipistrellus kuhlii]|uniref:Cysteine rich secretory protein 3 n=1 Tax=Pipistrellus kuhlii TaxID=59472 RepID=A0A7J7YLE2_PIPKU|nr:cysteine-rich secretory protein 3 [Pipistrellus kuhlii]KAF6362704.1 cysteine rich secretory protein 3 [Pipistrellus kuhlii]